MRTALVTTMAVLVFSAAGSAAAQSTIYIKNPSIPSRFTLALDGVMSQPKGDFAQNVGRGWGGNVTGMFRLDRDGYVQLRADGGMLQYGNETKRIPLNPLTGRVSLKVETSNLIGWGGIGGQ